MYLLSAVHSTYHPSLIYPLSLQRSLAHHAHNLIVYTSHIGRYAATAMQHAVENKQVWFVLDLYMWSVCARNSHVICTTSHVRRYTAMTALKSRHLLTATHTHHLSLFSHVPRTHSLLHLPHTQYTLVTGHIPPITHHTPTAACALFITCTPHMHPK